MEPRCTCGATLPEDARFCHKCGKPQYAEDIARLEQPVSSAPAQRPIDVPGSTVRPATAIGFGNIRAIVTTMASAALSLIALMLAAVVFPPLGPLVICAAGYFAATLYRRQTKDPLSTGGGAFLGLLTGLWLFLVLALSCLFVLRFADPAELLRSSTARVPDLAKTIRNPAQIETLIKASLLPMLFLTTVAGAFGGMLAARLSARRRPS